VRSAAALHAVDVLGDGHGATVTHAPRVKGP
jgi:hypothetical protein